VPCVQEQQDRAQGSSATRFRAELSSFGRLKVERGGTSKCGVALDRREQSTWKCLECVILGLYAADPYSHPPKASQPACASVRVRVCAVPIRRKQ
jgi:hypothetical protein